MEVYVNYPTTEEGWDMLYDAVAEVHAILVMKAIEDLPINDTSKRKVLKGVVEEAKRRALEEKRNKNAKSIKNLVDKYKLKTPIYDE